MHFSLPECCEVAHLGHTITSSGIVKIEDSLFTYIHLKCVMCDAGVLSFHALLSSFLQQPQHSCLDQWAELSAKSDEYFCDGADRLVLACAALFGTSQASGLARSNLISTGMASDSAPCPWWARMCLQPDISLTAFCARLVMVADAGGRDVLVSAACEHAWPGLVSSLQTMLKEYRTTIYGLEAMRMIASESTARDWVWHSRKELCEAALGTLQGAMSDAGCNIERVREFVLRVYRASELLTYVGWYEEALQPMRQLMLHLCASNMGHLVTAHCRSSIACLLIAQAKYQEALVEHNAALDIRRNVLGEQHPYVAVSRDSKGYTFSRLGRYGEALVEHKAALAIRLPVLGEQHPDVATSRNDIGCTLSDMGQDTEALVELKAALAIRLAVLGEQHPGVATSRNNIGDT
jgi:hypothetical protein